MKILIIGCGFLGKSLYERLKNTLPVTVTQTSTKKKADFLDFELLTPHTYRKLQTLLKKFDTLVISAAPKNRAAYAETYLHLARRIKDALKNCPKKTVIYTSSSGVYAESSGAIVAENSPLDLDHSHILVETEKTYLSLQRNHRVVIARLSGLVGPGRNMKKFYEKYESEPMVKKYINLVDVQDAAKFLEQASTLPIRGIYNVSLRTLWNTDLFTEIFGYPPQNIVSGQAGDLNKRICAQKMQNL